MVNQIHAKKLQNIMHFELILMFLLVFMTVLPSIAEFCHQALHNVKQFTSPWLLPCMSWFGIIQGYCQISANSRPTASNLASIWQYPWIIPNHDIAAIIMAVNYYNFYLCLMLVGFIMTSIATVRTELSLHNGTCEWGMTFWEKKSKYLSCLWWQLGLVIMLWERNEIQIKLFLVELSI